MRKTIFLFVLDYMPNPIKLAILKVEFFLKHKYKITLNSPKSFNEKILYRKLFQSNNPLFSLCADKYAVRNYLKEKVGEEYLIPLKDMVTDVDDLKFDNYGNNFVIKATHDCGSVNIIQDQNFDREKLKDNLKSKLKIDYGKLRAEPWYSKIPPRIVVEHLLIDKNNKPPTEYKFHVFKNTDDDFTVITQVDYNKHKDRSTSYYSENGTFLKFKIFWPYKKGALKKPSNYTEMLDIAKKLAEDFDYVRVDLYNLNGKIYFGELSFSHASGLIPIEPRKYDFLLGSYWQLAMKE